MDAELPEEILRFLDQIESLEHLEILLLMRTEGARALEPVAVSLAVGIPESKVERRLEELRSRGLLAKEGRSYRYAPGKPEDAEVISRLADAYRERRLTVIHAVSERALRRLRQFADAFRVRRDGGND